MSHEHNENENLQDVLPEVDINELRQVRRAKLASLQAEGKTLSVKLNLISHIHLLKFLSNSRL